MMLAESFLHRMQRSAVGRETLDGLDLMPVRHHCQCGARLHGLAVEMDDTGAALRGVAADMSTCQPQMLPQKLDEQRARFDLPCHRIAVHDQ